jgi:hypothetical protein
MNYTWGEIQILAIQKMFLNNEVLDVNNLDTYRADRKYSLYLNSMPAVANEGLLRLMSVGRPLIKKYTLSYNIPDNIYDYQSYETNYVSNEDLIINGLISKSYYFEINNNATIQIQEKDNDVWSTIKTINHVATVAGSYEIYKGLISNPNNREIRIVFKQNGYLYAIRNVALYNINFRFEDEVYANTQKQKYDLKTLISDFYDIISVEYEKDETKGYYNADYVLEGDNILVIDSKLKGNFIITYKAYPVKITSSTADTYKFTQPSEMIALLPLYIASELYKDDDAAQATIYRNEFEISLSNIKTIEEPMEFANNSNWL